MKKIYDRLKNILALIKDRFRRYASRISPSSVWTRLGIGRFVTVKEVVYWSVAVLSCALIIFFCAQSGEKSAGMSSGLVEFLSRFLPIGNDSVQAEYVIRKIGHFTVFMFETVFLTAALIHTFGFRKTVIIFLFALEAILAGVSEGVQFFASDRGPKFGDVLIDLGGAVFGFFVYMIYYCARIRSQKRRMQEEKKNDRVRIFEKNTKWLTASEFSALSPVNVFHREGEESAQKADENLQNYHMYARRAFRVGSHAERAEILITADDYYKLYINGVYVCQGPAPGYPGHYYVNRVDVLEYLKSGENVIAVDCYYQGLVNRVWVSGDQRQGFMCELHVDGKVILRSDEHFHYMKSTSYTQKHEIGYQTQFTEHFDLRCEPVGWRDVGYDDFMWTACSVKAETDYKFAWQETPVLATEIVKPDKVDTRGQTVHIDFGSEIAGVVLSSFRGKRGAKVVLRLAEEEENGSAKWKMRCGCEYEHTLILDGRVNEWELFDYCAFRYADIIMDEGVKLVSVEARRQFYPFDEKACVLETTEKNLSEVFELCKNTIKTGVQEGYLDCPTREKGQYSGDLVITSLAHLYLSGDIRLYKKALDDWMRSGSVAPALLAVFPSSFMQEIADYSLLFPMTAWRYYEHSGNIEYLKETYEYADRIVETYSRYARRDGLIENVKEAWNLVDWPENLRDGYDFNLSKPVGDGCHNVINAYYLGAILYTEKMAAALKINREKRFETLSGAFNDAFFSMDTNLYVDAIGSSHSAIHSNIMPLFFGIVPNDKREEISQYLIKRKMCTGVFMAYFYMKALCMCGKYKAVYDLIVSEDPNSWMNMIKQGATTLFEAWGKEQKWNTSLCHPWASAPVPVLIEDILGITPEVVRGGVWKQYLPLTVRHLKITVPVMDSKVTFERSEDETNITIERQAK